MNSRLLKVLLADITQNHDENRLSLSQRQYGVRPGNYPCYGPEGIIAQLDSYAYEGEYILVTLSRDGPRAVLANGRFSVTPRVHVLSCGPGVEAGFLRELINAVSGSQLTNLKKLEALGFSLPNEEVQRHILRALSCIEEKAALLRDQNRVLYGMIRSLFDRFFIFGPGSPRPLGDFAEYRPLSGAAEERSAEESQQGSVFYNLFLSPRGDLHPLFISALIKNPEFLRYTESCIESGIGRRRFDGERLMTFEMSGPPGRNQAVSGAYREFNRFAETAEKKLAGNHAELLVLQKLRRSLLPLSV
jgi:hypothetical protein